MIVYNYLITQYNIIIFNLVLNIWVFYNNLKFIKIINDKLKY